MSQQKHTPGPWETYEGATPSIVAGEVGNAQIIANRLTEANAARIVACVNAFEGVEDPEEWMLEAKDERRGFWYEECKRQREELGIIIARLREEIDSERTALWNERARNAKHT